MAEGPARKPVTALEPVLLFIGAAGLGCMVLRALVTGWVWIPGSRHSFRDGYWTSRTDDLNNYLVYLVIIGAATLVVLAMAIARLRQFNRQTPGRGGH